MTHARTVSMVTCSYAPDAERCRALCATVRRFAAPEVGHTIIVPRRDMDLFRPIAGDRATLLDVESVLPGWMRRPPGSTRWWLTLCSPPVRGWIVQQITKVAAAAAIDADALVFADSEMLFIRPFGPGHVLRDGLVRLYRLPGEGRLPTHERWHRRAAELLGLPPTDYFGSDYIGPLVSWRRDTALAMQRRIEETTKGPWLRALCRSLHLSEYILYGVFAEHVLGEGAGHYNDDAQLCHVAWAGSISGPDDIARFAAGIGPGHVAALVQSTLGMSASDYADTIAAAAAEQDAAMGAQTLA